MIELTRCDELIKQFEQLHKLKVHKIPLEYFDGRRVLLLMCKCSGVWTLSNPKTAICSAQRTSNGR